MHKLASYLWPLLEQKRPHAHVLIVHGLGEHAQRYAELATELNAAGYSVSAYDQYGHGHSLGARGDLLEPTQLLDDLNLVVHETRTRLDREFGPALGGEVPLVVLGHSLGGLLAASWASRQGDANLVQGIVLSSPAIALRLRARDRVLLKIAGLLLQHVAVANGLKPQLLSRSDAAVQRYLQDPLVHDRISGMLGQFMATEGAQVLARAQQWQLPCLLMWGGADGIVDPQGSAQLAATIPPAYLSAHEWSGYYHEIFHEAPAERAPVVAMLLQWLAQRFAV